MPTPTPTENKTKKEMGHRTWSSQVEETTWGVTVGSCGLCQPLGASVAIVSTRVTASSWQPILVLLVPSACFHWLRSCWSSSTQSHIITPPNHRRWSLSLPPMQTRYHLSLLFTPSSMASPCSSNSKYSFDQFFQSVSWIRPNQNWPGQSNKMLQLHQNRFRTVNKDGINTSPSS